MNNPISNDNLTVELLDGLDATAMQQSLYFQLALNYLPLRWRAPMGRLIETIDQGVPVEVAVEQLRSKLPCELHSIIQAGMQMPDAGRFVLDVIRVRWDKQRLLRNLAAILAYPIALLLASLFIAVAASLTLAPTLINLTESFGLAGMSPSIVLDQQSASLGMLGIFFWCVFTGLAVKWVGPKWGTLSVLGGLPYVGKAFRWISLFEIVQRLEAIAQQGLGGVTATERASLSFVDSPLEASCLHIARRQAAGVPIGESLSQSLLSDGLCGPILLAMDYPSRGQPDFAHAAQVLWRLAELRLNTLSTIFPFLIFILIVNIVVGTMSTYLGLLVNLIRLLSAF